MYIQNIKNNKNFSENFENAILVGSSGDLLGKNKGEFINTFPLIIRMNDSPTIGFEKDVGNRTDIRIVNFKALNTITKLNPKEFINTKHIILYTNNQNDKLKLLQIFKNFNINLHIFTPLSIHYNDELFKKYTNVDRMKSGSWLSTGWFSLFFLINYVKNKNIIGLGGEFEHSLYHYYGKNLKQKNYYISNQNSSQGHRFITEKQIFSKWIVEKNINFHKL
jgi:hypothetical protein